MKFYRKTLWIPTLFCTLLIFACVTINIYFPAEKVESVAGEIVNDIRGQEGGAKDKSLKNQKDSLFRQTIMAFFSPVAHAEEVVTVSNPTIRALKQKMKARFGRMKPFYKKGMLKEGGNGYVSLGSTGGLGLKDKRNLKALVGAENRDRKSLYAEVGKALKIDPGQTGKIAGIFAKEWQKSVK
ncbi:MAG: DUF1318 domain-containing protein [Deltaproteobacteria bacterium]|nr:DUF1318 domain-containing protein [Deltaproteobacteria bacterium]